MKNLNLLKVSPLALAVSLATATAFAPVAVQAEASGNIGVHSKYLLHGIGLENDNTALQGGLDVASGDWVVCLDADTRPRPELPVALVRRAVADGTDLLSVAGRFTGESSGARWLHASVLTTLVYRFGPPGWSPSPDRLLVNGQCMAVRSETMRSVGGWEAVAGSVVEDVALARHLAAAGQRVDFLDAGELLTGDVAGVGYLLKDRVIDVDDFLVSVRRVANGGSAIDAEVVSQILGRSQRSSDLDRLTPREREVLTLMAEGLSNGGIADRLVVSHGAVEKHISNVFMKLGLDVEESSHRRVLAVLTYLRGT